MGSEVDSDEGTAEDAPIPESGNASSEGWSCCVGNSAMLL